jgi:hypothetical protein
LISVSALVISLSACSEIVANGQFSEYGAVSNGSGGSLVSAGSLSHTLGKEPLYANGPVFKLSSGKFVIFE